MTAPAIGSGASHPPGKPDVVTVPSAPSPSEGAPPRAHWARAGHTLVTVTGLRLLRSGLSIMGSALRRAWQHRVLGLSAEAGFWQLLSLPSLAFALVGLMGYLDPAIGNDTIQRLRTDILDWAGRSLTPDTVDSVVRPVLDSVLTGSHAGVISISFVLSLWSGSSAMATFVNTITIAYDQRDLRGAVASRFLALWLYLLSVIAVVVILPVLVLGPSNIKGWKIVEDHPVLSDIIGLSYWPVVALLCLAALCTLYHLAPPVRPRWRDTIPGAVIAAALWMLGSIGLRSYIHYVFHRTLDYGVLAAPVAILLFCYITALALLLGAEVNAETDRRRAARMSAPKDPAAPAAPTLES